ncbi:MAG: hypothetical protein ACI93G_000103 [Hyphomonas sp.]|jgi:hypothetical protein
MMSGRVIGGIFFTGMAAVAAMIFYSHTYTMGVDVSLWGIAIIALAGALLGSGAWKLWQLFSKSNRRVGRAQ